MQSIREVDIYGNVSYKLDGKFHREDGPAVERANGGKSWFLNGKRHREDGPAIEFADGDKSWYLHGKHCKSTYASGEVVVEKQNSFEVEYLEELENGQTFIQDEDLTDMGR